jgi:hypothetical protein
VRWARRWKRSYAHKRQPERDVLTETQAWNAFALKLGANEIVFQRGLFAIRSSIFGKLKINVSPTAFKLLGAILSNVSSFVCQ